MALPTVKLARNPEETCIDIIPLAQEGGSFVYQPTNIRSCLIAEYLFLAGKDLQNSEIFTKLSKTFETTTGSPIQIEVK
jgi:hypothetical protein